MNDRYLGDGVYASWDGYHIWLDLRAQDSTTRIALDPEVFRALVAFEAAVALTIAKEEEKAKQPT